MNSKEVMEYLRAHGSERTKQDLMSQGAKEPLFGVKMADLKALKKKINMDHGLALELWATGNSDAMNLAAMIADPLLTDKALLDQWITEAYWDGLSDNCIVALAASKSFGFELAREWVRSENPMIKASGYALYWNRYMFQPDSEIDLMEASNILKDIGETLKHQDMRIQNAMNNYVIMTGIYVEPLFKEALKVAEIIGAVEPLIAQNSCNMQTATEYLLKYEEKGQIGKKRKGVSTP